MNDLLNQFLGFFPNSTHAADRKRFIKYAFDKARKQESLDISEFRNAGVSEKNIKMYESIYSWIRDIQELLDAGEL